MEGKKNLFPFVILMCLMLNNNFIYIFGTFHIGFGPRGVCAISRKVFHEKRVLLYFFVFYFYFFFSIVLRPRKGLTPYLVNDFFSTLPFGFLFCDSIQLIETFFWGIREEFYSAFWGFSGCGYVGGPTWRKSDDPKGHSLCKFPRTAMRRNYNAQRLIKTRVGNNVDAKWEIKERKKKQKKIPRWKVKWMEIVGRWTMYWVSQFRF